MEEKWGFFNYLAMGIWLLVMCIVGAYAVFYFVTMAYFFLIIGVIVVIVLLAVILGG
jgi:hypothetical protein